MDSLKTNYESFLWVGFICLKAAEPLLKFSGVPATHLIDKKSMKVGWVVGGGILKNLIAFIYFFSVLFKLFCSILSKVHFQ